MGLKCELKSFSESLYIIFYIIPSLPQRTPGCCQNVERQSKPGGGKWEGLQPGQGWEAPAARKGHTGAVLDSVCRAVGAGILNHCSHGQGSACGPGASTALPEVASGVERLQIIFMGDNKNVLPHNQHKTVARVSFSLKQHVLNEHSADKCCKSCKAMHRIIQHALL